MNIPLPDAEPTRPAPADRERIEADLLALRRQLALPPLVVAMASPPVYETPPTVRPTTPTPTPIPTPTQTPTPMPTPTPTLIETIVPDVTVVPTETTLPVETIWPTPVVVDLPTTDLPTTGLVPAPEERRFRIGYHARTTQAALSSAFFEQLAQFMERSPETQEALKEAGYGSGRVVALRAEDHFDLIQRMNQEEFDMVFCSAVAFVQQTGRYVAFLQTYNPGRGDVEIPGKGPRRWGVAVVSRDHPDFADGPLDLEDMRRFIAEARMAVVSNHSAAGYLYPTIELMKQYGARPRELIFCDASDEVAKFVINGLVDLGALDEKALEDVAAQIPDSPQADSLVTTVARASVPTDPVVILPALTPPRSRLSPALARAIRLFCGQLVDSPLTVVDIQTSPYDEVGESILELHQRSAALMSRAAAAGETP